VGTDGIPLLKSVLTARDEDGTAFLGFGGTPFEGNRVDYTLARICSELSESNISNLHS
jgi:hypothetical protein